LARMASFMASVNCIFNDIIKSLIRMTFLAAQINKRLN
jgi:hypothetical protein